MKYDMLPYKTVARVWDTFQGHSCCDNEKYASFKGKDNYWYSDRDRFVSQCFKKYANKYIVFIDKQKVGYQMDNYFCFQEPESVYKPHYGERDYCSHGEPIIRTQKKYLRVDGFRAVNEMYGHGFIEMSCTDVFGDKFAVRLDYNNMCHIQFKEIPKAEFDSITQLFEDDREPMPFKVKRYFTYEEIKERKVKGKKVKKSEGCLVHEEVVVMAKDIDEAAKVLPNTINAERVQDG